MDTRKTSKSVKMQQIQNNASSKSKSSKRRARRAALNKAAGPPQLLYPNPSYTNTGLRKMVSVNRKRLTPGGEAFLKCAFAPPDFAASAPTGVPDDFRGTSLLKKHRLVSTFNCTSSSTDCYILLTPSVGGVAYWTALVAAGTGFPSTGNFTPVYYSDTTALFSGPGAMASNFTKFRYVSNHIELIPTMNQMSWAGSIQAWKIPIAMAIRSTTTVADNLYTVTGLESINATNANQYTGPANLGVYSAAYNTGANFDFQPIIEGVVQVPNSIVSGTDYGRLAGAIGGIDPNFDSVIIKISGMGTNVLNSFIVKTWACIEYQVQVNSSVYEYQTLSPCDPYAMELYRAIILQLPVGVSFLDNDGFWQRVLGIIKTVSGALSAIPGPYGAIAGGVNAISTGIESLTL
jgi:hypothetical protein